MSTPDLRPVTDDEWLDYARFWSGMFHEDPHDDEATAWARTLPPERCLTATDDLGHIASSGAIPFGLTVPGGATLGCAGITIVTVRPDHRRRGLLRAMMRRLHDDARGRGEPVAALYASESPIYGRFGYGAAVPMSRVQIRRSALATVAGGDATAVSLVTCESFVDLARRVSEAIGRGRGGMLVMGPEAWDTHARNFRGKRPDRYAAVGDRGVVRYRTSEGEWADRVPDASLEVMDLFALDGEAEADLWAHVASVDLVTEITAHRRPVDDPLRWRVADEARVRDRPRMPLFVRLLDVRTALTARTWEVADTLVLEVSDVFEPANHGRWRLDAGPDGSTCTTTDAEPDVRLDVADLASLWLGGIAPATLAAAGRLVAHDDVVARLRRLFAVDRPPWTPFDF